MPFVSLSSVAADDLSQVRNGCFYVVLDGLAQFFVGGTDHTIIGGLDARIGHTEDAIGGALTMVAEELDRVARFSAFLPHGVKGFAGIWQ